jgi:TPR repeat protein
LFTEGTPLLTPIYERVASPYGQGRFSATWWLALVALTACVVDVAPAAANTLTAGERAFLRHDYARAAQLLMPEAQLGGAVAQTYIGYMYQDGLGVPRDYSVAAGWLNQAAQQGEPTAQFLLGLLFDKGFGLPQDWVQAEVWLNLATSRASEKERDYWRRVRDAVAQKLTLNQFAEAQRRAFDWMPIASRRDSIVYAPRD